MQLLKRLGFGPSCLLVRNAEGLGARGCSAVPARCCPGLTLLLAASGAANADVETQIRRFAAVCSCFLPVEPGRGSRTGLRGDEGHDVSLAALLGLVQGLRAAPEATMALG